MKRYYLWAMIPWAFLAIPLWREVQSPLLWFQLVCFILVIYDLYRKKRYYLVWYSVNNWCWRMFFMTENKHLDILEAEKTIKYNLEEKWICNTNPVILTINRIHKSQYIW